MCQQNCHMHKLLTQAMDVATIYEVQQWNLEKYEMDQMKDIYYSPIFIPDLKYNGAIHITNPSCPIDVFFCLTWIFEQVYLLYTYNVMHIEWYYGNMVAL